MGVPKNRRLLGRAGFDRRLEKAAPPLLAEVADPNHAVPVVQW